MKDRNYLDNTQSKQRTETFEEEDDDVSRERLEYLERRQKLRELERQKMVKGTYGSGTRGKTLASEQGRGNGGSASRLDTGTSSTKDKKRSLPYDRSYGSFFGPSEPVVAKRIIEEARAREEAQIIAARVAQEAKEAERRNSAKTAASRAHEDRPAQKPAKPVDPVVEKARLLKEARDYSCLFSDTAELGPVREKRTGLAAPKPGTDKSREVVKAAIGRRDKSEVERPPRSRVGTSNYVGLGPNSASGLVSSSKSTQVKSKPSHTPHPLSGQRHERSSADRPSISSKQNGSAGSLPRKPLHGKVSSAGPGRPDPRKDVGPKKHVVAPNTVNGNKLKAKDGLEDRRSTPSRTVDRRPVPSQAADRRSLPTTLPERRHPPLHGIDRDKRLLAPQTSTDGIKKRVPASASYRPAQQPSSGVPEPKRQISTAQSGRQALQSRPPPKSASRPEASEQRRPKYSDDLRSKRARSSDDDSDSFVVDDDANVNVSSMIRSMFRYDPSKYRGDDDDDRGMEVGFRTIQAEERRSAREARLEDERELELIEAEEREERLRKKKKKKM